MLILVGSGGDRVSSAVRQLVDGGARGVDLGFGIGVIAFSMVANVVVSSFIARRARATDSPALEGDAAHLRTDAATSGRRARRPRARRSSPAQRGSTRRSRWSWRRAIVVAGVRLLSRSSRVLVDEALPADELEAIAETVVAFGATGRRRLPQAARAPRRGPPLRRPARAVPSQGTTLEDAHDDRPRAAGRDPRAPATGADVAHPSRARGPRPAGDRDPRALTAAVSRPHRAGSSWTWCCDGRSRSTPTRRSRSRWQCSSSDPVPIAPRRPPARRADDEVVRRGEAQLARILGG